MPEPEDAAAATERWFVRRGLPHFTFRYSASRDVLARVVPLVVVVFVLEIVVTAPNRKYPVLGSIAAAIGGLAVLVGAYILCNLVRGRRWRAMPVRIGLAEVAIFVVGPALVPLAFGGQWRSALVTGGVNLLVLVLFYVVTSYGIFPMTRWACAHGARQLKAVSGVLVRALPLLLLVVIVVFYTVEPFQIGHELPWPLLLFAVVFFLLVATLFAAIRVPRQVGALSDGDGWPELRGRAGATPAAPLCRELPARPPKPPGLSRREWLNVGLVVMVNEAVLVLLVGLAMFVFLVALGVITVPLDLTRTWLGAEPHVLASFTLFDTKLALTGELVKAAAFLAGFACLQFTVSLLSDTAYQAEFLEQLHHELRDSLAARAVYVTVMIRRATAAATP